MQLLSRLMRKFNECIMVGLWRRGMMCVNRLVILLNSEFLSSVWFSWLMLYRISSVEDF